MSNTRFTFGLCCIHNGLKEQGVSFKTMTYKSFSKMDRKAAIEKLSKIYENNLYVVYRILIECEKRGWAYRVSSDIFPLLTYDIANIRYEELPNVDRIDHMFNLCSNLSQFHGIRLSCHPDQFNVLASEDENAINRTISELNYHAWFMDKMGAFRSYLSPINIHINCSSGNIIDIAERFKRNFDRTNEGVRSRLVVENEDKGVWNARNLTDVFRRFVSIPITFDYLHHACNGGGMTEQEAFYSCYNTWDCVPLFHYSESIPGEKNKRKHANYPLRLPDTYNQKVDIDFEFKDKEKAIMAGWKLF